MKLMILMLLLSPYPDESPLFCISIDYLLRQIIENWTIPFLDLRIPFPLRHNPIIFPSNPILEFSTIPALRAIEFAPKIPVGSILASLTRGHKETAFKKAISVQPLKTHLMRLKSLPVNGLLDPSWRERPDLFEPLTPDILRKIKICWCVLKIRAKGGIQRGHFN